MLASWETRLHDRYGIATRAARRLEGRNQGMWHYGYAIRRSSFLLVWTLILAGALAGCSSQGERTVIVYQGPDGAAPSPDHACEPHERHGGGRCMTESVRLPNRDRSIFHGRITPRRCRWRRLWRADSDCRRTACRKSPEAVSQSSVRIRDAIPQSSRVVTIDEAASAALLNRDLNAFWAKASLSGRFSHFAVVSEALFAHLGDGRNDFAGAATRRENARALLRVHGRPLTCSRSCAASMRHARRGASRRCSGCLDGTTRVLVGRSGATS
jgi:hypothetical protein